MGQTVEIVRHYSDEIQNDRTIEYAYEKLQEEVAELGVEIQNGSTGEDGIKGEVMDVVNCALDILFKAHPEITMKQIDALMEAKCRKWMKNYSTHDENVDVEGMQESAEVLKEFRECEVPTGLVAELAGTSSNSIRRILAGSLPSRRTRARLHLVSETLRPAFGEYLYGVAWFWKRKDSEGRTLRDILSGPVVDLSVVRDYLSRQAGEIEKFKSGYQGYDERDDDASEQG